MLIALLVVQPFISLLVIIILGGASFFIFTSLRKMLDKIAVKSREYQLNINQHATDEATSSLDTMNEKAIQETIYSFKGKQTLIIIAHRLTTVESCDVIIQLEKGRIKKMGKITEEEALTHPSRTQLDQCVGA
ncbi:hypothetical protein GMMP1_690005 [Candidatus Magnetomoraceae bacterium gMMP-1]